MISKFAIQTQNPLTRQRLSAWAVSRRRPAQAVDPEQVPREKEPEPPQVCLRNRRR